MDGSLDNEALHNVRKLAESAQKLHFPIVYAHFTAIQVQVQGHSPAPG